MPECNPTEAIRPSYMGCLPSIHLRIVVKSTIDHHGKRNLKSKKQREYMRRIHLTKRFLSLSLHRWQIIYRSLHILLVYFHNIQMACFGSSYTHMLFSSSSRFLSLSFSLGMSDSNRSHPESHRHNESKSVVLIRDYGSTLGSTLT